MSFPDKKYNIIYADPPWEYSSKSYQDSNREMLKLDETQYKTLSVHQIKDLPIKEITANDCILFLWSTDSHLKEAIDVIESWSLHFKTIGFTWVKQYASGSYCYNFSPYTLKSTEVCLIGIKGKLKNIKKTNNVKGLVFAERTKHSKKPNEVRDRIVNLCGDLPRIELFARNTTPGWDVWGDQA